MLEIREASRFDISRIAKYDKHISQAELINVISLGRAYAAFENGVFVGWLRFGLFWDNTPFMNMLYILKEKRGEGYGRQMVEFWEDKMRRLGYDVVMTSTPSDEYSQHFYHKLGYKTIGGFIMYDAPYEMIMAKKI